MHDLPAHRVLLLVLDDHGLRLAAVDLEVEQRVPLGEHRAQQRASTLNDDAVAVDAA